MHIMCKLMSMSPTNMSPHLINRISCLLTWLIHSINSSCHIVFITQQQINAYHSYLTGQEKLQLLKNTYCNNNVCRSTQYILNSRVIIPSRHPAGHLHPIITYRVPASLALLLQSHIKFHIPIGEHSIDSNMDMPHGTTYNPNIMCNVNIQCIIQ